VTTKKEFAEACDPAKAQSDGCIESREGRGAPARTELSRLGGVPICQYRRVVHAALDRAARLIEEKTLNDRREVLRFAVKPSSTGSRK
jgi:hypothetical protein